MQPVRLLTRRRRAEELSLDAELFVEIKPGLSFYKGDSAAVR